MLLSIKAATGGIRKRNRANGEGAIVAHKNRKKPYEVQVTLGYVNIGNECKRKMKSLGYYKTKQEAKAALDAYNVEKRKREITPDDFNRVISLTFKDIYEQWSAEKYDESIISHSTVVSNKCSYKELAALYDIPFVTITGAMFEKTMRESNKNYPTTRKMRCLYSSLCTYAMKKGYMSVNRAKTIRFDKKEKDNLNPNKIDRNPFESQELKLIFEDDTPKNEKIKDIVTFMLYTGVRISELMNLNKTDIYLTDMDYFAVQKSKTDAGKRLIPINKAIKPIVEKYLKINPDEPALFTTNKGTRFDDSTFRRNYWTPYMKALHIKHYPHDTRHTFRSYWKALRLDSDYGEIIMGHQTQTVDVIYKHYFVKYLCDEMDKFHYDFEKGSSDKIEYENDNDLVPGAPKRSTPEFLKK